MTELSLKGKEFVYNHHLAVPFRPLVPLRPTFPQGCEFHTVPVGQEKRNG